MPEDQIMNFIIAIIFISGMVIFIVLMFGYQLVASGKRVRKARRLASLVVEYTPAFIMVVFDESDRVTAFSARDSAFEGGWQEPLKGKRRENLAFLPAELREPFAVEPGGAAELVVARTTAPLHMVSGRILFIDWHLQLFPNEEGEIEFKVLTGFDRTELVQTQQKLKALSANLAEMEEKQRKRIADDLHDQIGEILVTSSRSFQTLKKQYPALAQSEEIDKLSQIIQKFTKATRSLIFDLIPPELFSIGLGASLETLASKLSRQFNITIRVDGAQQECPLDESIALFLHKAAHEFVVNAAKHSGADEILIRLQCTGDFVRVAVHDNGSGFAVGTGELDMKSDSGYGLFTVQNRAEHYDGGLEIAESEELGGGQITVWVPLIRTEENQPQ